MQNIQEQAGLVTITLDLNKICTQQNREEAFKKAALEFFTNSRIMNNLAEQTINSYINGACHKFITENLDKVLTKDFVDNYIKANHYKIGIFVGEELKERKEIFVKPVVEYLTSVNYAPIIGKIVQDRMVEIMEDILSLLEI